MAQQAPPKSEAEAWLASLDAYEAGIAEQQQLEIALRDGDRIREECKPLIGYIRHAWHILEPATPLKIGWAIEAMSEHYEAISYGQIQNLLTNCPPGLMKSLLQNVFFPSWEWGSRGLDHMRYVCTSYGLDLTNRDGSKFLRLVQSPWYHALWPKVALSRNAVDNLENTNTGTRVGVPWSKSMGKRGNRFMFDDPHDLENAESDDQRERVVRLWQEGATSRLNDPETDSFVGVMQRLHGKDLSGWILENDSSFTHLMLPQEFERDRKCITYRKNGTKLFEDPRTKEKELLFPERYNRAYVDKRRKLIGEYAYAGQDQQRPGPRGGGVFDRDWFKNREVEHASELPAKIVRVVRGWDLAATDLKALKKTGARTAGVKLALLANDEWAILHCVAKGYGPAKVRVLLKTTATADGTSVEISLPQDPAQAGKAQKASNIKLLAGYNVRITVESGDKVTRFMPFSVQCEMGNVWMVKGPWTTEFYDELQNFPNSGRKDVADACSRAFNHFLLKKKPGGGNGIAAPIVCEPEMEDEDVT